MHDLRCADPDEMHYTELRNKARYFKQTEEGVAEMSAVFEAIAERIRVKSFEEGESIGISKGKAEGRSEGLKEGETDGIRRVARNLIADGTPTSKVSEFTSLSIEEVNNLRKSMSL